MKSDVLPLLCKKQFSLHKRKIKEINAGFGGGVNASSNLATSVGGSTPTTAATTATATTAQKRSSSSKQPRPKLFDYIRQDEVNYLVNKMASNRLNHDMVSVYAFIQADGFCYRSNTLAIYAEANKQVNKRA